jgi:hypothetical protein
VLKPYDVFADPIIHALIAEAQADPDVIGFVLLGSRSVGVVREDSDYDGIFVVTDEAAARYELTQSAPARGSALNLPDSALEIWHDSPGGMQIGKFEEWLMPAFAEAVIVYDRTGETTRIIQQLSRMPADQAQAAVARWYDTYLNGLYRSLKAWSCGLELGGRMEAAETANALLYLLYALDARWRPYSSRLDFHLDQIEHQGWQPGELRTALLDLITTGNPIRQQSLARRVIPLLRERGYGQHFDAWEGKIDQALAWDFPETA